MFVVFIVCVSLVLSGPAPAHAVSSYARNTFDLSSELSGTTTLDSVVPLEILPGGMAVSSC